jgi:hypothetical protein
MVVVIEPFAGSAALSMFICSAKSPVSYAGSKAGYACTILSHLGLLPDDITTVVLNDPGIWGDIWPALVADTLKVAEEVDKLAKSPGDARALYDGLMDRIQGAATAHQRAALCLCRIAGTFGSKEVGGFRGLHKNRPNVDGFIPSRHALVKRLADLAPALAAREFVCTKLDARNVDVGRYLDKGRVIIYMDPPYLGSESVYQHKITRLDVVKLALEWASLGADVVVSEAAPIPELTAAGWKVVDISLDRVGQGRKNSRSASEKLTMYMH